MKKTLLALAVPALLAASAANAATVYEKDGQKFEVTGRAQANYFNNAASDSNGSTVQGSARLGLRGSSAINDTWSAIARGEWQIAAENSDKDKKKVYDENDHVIGYTDADEGQFTTRHLYAGFDGSQYGTLIAGQTDTAYYAVVAPTDIFNEWGSYGNSYWGYRGGAANFGGRQEGQIIYSNSFGGFRGGVSYRLAEDTENLDKSYAGNLGYDFGFGVGVTVAADQYDSQDGLADQSDWGLSATYGTFGEGLYLAGVYTQSEIEQAGIENTHKGYELAATYTLANSLGFLGGYNYTEDENDVELTDEFLVGAMYNFTSNLLGYTEFALDQRDDADNLATVALQYNF
ncbi:MAG: porin [Aeromonadaceae bacterium]